MNRDDILVTTRGTEINKLLERITRDHRADIKAFTSGHLNERNLFVPPELRRKTWSGAKVTTNTATKKCLHENQRKNMVDALSAFSARPMPETRSRIKPLDHRRDIIEYDTSFFMVPRPQGFKSVPSVHVTLTNKEKLISFKNFSKIVLNTENKISPAVITNLISKSSEDWDSYNVYNPTLQKVIIYYKEYNKHIKQSFIYRHIPEYISQIDERDKQSESQKILELEKLILSKLKDKSKILLEYEDVKNELANANDFKHLNAVTVKDSSKSVFPEPDTVTNVVENLRRQILKKKDDLKEIKAKQKNDMVPIQVFQSMVKCVQASKVDVEKLHRRLDSFRKRQLQAKGDLKTFISGIGLVINECYVMKFFDIDNM